VCGWGGGAQVRWRLRSDDGARRLGLRSGWVAVCRAQQTLVGAMAADSSLESKRKT
jgi:hypothetical protein